MAGVHDDQEESDDSKLILAGKAMQPASDSLHARNMAASSLRTRGLQVIELSLAKSILPFSVSSFFSYVERAFLACQGAALASYVEQGPIEVLAS